ncbi:hypothetical protein BRYFOR_09405 [Marvinbryantia formatexigens DSM 14469]|uniref:Uncharacterized protein n=1 Tax=Marvinbryantia formatexigens DSM 14469 TaxID=478749 RepID=C6LL58_9FIRM|nr:hypothetical protein BRYFOR_09405 [Marvinbryantia formatexigens DSM 14469]
MRSGFINSFRMYFITAGNETGGNRLSQKNTEFTYRDCLS